MPVIGRSEVAETVPVWLAPVQGLHKCDEAGFWDWKNVSTGWSPLWRIKGTGSGEWPRTGSFGRSNTKLWPCQGCFVAYGPSVHGGSHPFRVPPKGLKTRFIYLFIYLFFLLEKKMSELSTRGQRAEASWLYANTEEAGAACHRVDTYGFTLCIDKEEWVSWHQRKLLWGFIQTVTFAVCH